MNKFVLVSFLLACVGCALAGYGSGTPGYYDPWTYYGGYDRYYNRYNNYGRNQPRPYYPISRYGGSGSSYDSRSRYNRPSSSYPTSRYGNSNRNRDYNRISYDDRMNDDYTY